MPSVTITVNGKPETREVENRTLLVQFLREHLGLTGTHVGCDTSQCGACVVHIDGYSAKSCTMLATQVNGSSVMPPSKASPRATSSIRCRKPSARTTACNAASARPAWS